MPGDRHHMAAGRTGANNHAVSNAGFTDNINGNDVLCFQVIDFIDNKILERFTLQRFPLGMLKRVSLMKTFCCMSANAACRRGLSKKSVCRNTELMPKKHDESNDYVGYRHS